MGKKGQPKFTEKKKKSAFLHLIMQTAFMNSFSKTIYLIIKIKINNIVLFISIYIGSL